MGSTDKVSQKNFTRDLVMPNSVVGLGAGGHAKVIIDILRLSEKWNIACLLDFNSDLKGKTIYGVPVLGDDALLPSLLSQQITHAFLGVGSVGDPSKRISLFTTLIQLGFDIVDVIHPSAVISPSVSMGKGPMVMAGVMINADTRIGDNVIINTGAVVEHDCRIGSHAHVATGAKLSGGVIVGEGAHIGTGAAIRNHITIGKHAVVGVGAAVVNDVPEGVVVGGTPAKELRRGGRNE